jgi:hypothetical protein
MPGLPSLPSTSATNNMTVSEDATQAPELLREEELAVVGKYTDQYKEASKQERYHMLKNKILPRLLPLNKNLPDNAWKVRKSVSTINNNIIYCYILIYQISSK